MSAAAPSTSVFVGNLAYDLSEQDVIDYFSQVGPVKNVRIATDRETGKPRGFGFIEFYDVATAESAVRNLNGSELNSRVMRIVFAEGGSGQRRDGDGDTNVNPRMRKNAFRNRPIGGDTAQHAGLGMADILGQDAVSEQLVGLLARKNRNELYEYLGQLQKYHEDNPQLARQMLLDNPQLTRALFMIEIALGIVPNPRGPNAPRSGGQRQRVGGADGDVTKHDAQPVYHPPPAPPMAPAPPIAATHSLSAPVDPRQRAKGGPPPHIPMTAAPRPMVSIAAQMAPGAPMPPAPAQMAAAQMPPATAAAQMPPATAAAQMPPATAAAQMPPATAAAPAQVPAVPGMTPEQQQALLQQVMSLTPEQIELLPPQQKSQVIALQQQLKGQV